MARQTEAYKLSMMIAQIRDLPRALLEGAGDDIADAIRAELKTTIRAQKTPWGVPWAPRKVGTKPVLVNAADALTVGADGTRILIRITGVEAQHHYGQVKGGTKRPMIPRGQDGGLPPKLVDAITQVLVKHFDAVTSGQVDAI